MKKRKFKSGGGIDEDIVARARRYAQMASKDSTEESDEQKAFVRKQRDADLREAQARDRAASKPVPKVVKPSKPSPDSYGNDKPDENMERERKAQRSAPAPDMYGNAEPDLNMERERMTQRSAPKPDMYGNAEPDLNMERQRRMEREADVPYETKRPASESTSFGRSMLNALTQGGAGDIRNMMSAMAPAATARMGRAFRRDAGEDLTEAAAKAFTRPQARKVVESEASKRARMVKERRDAAAEARRRRELDRMEGESMGPIKPRGNPQNQPPGPRNLDEIRMSGEGMGFRKGGKIKKYAQGGSVSARADGIAKRGKTKCKVY